MFLIRQSQIDQMQASRDSEFNRALIGFYRKNYRALVEKVNEEQLSRRISDAMSAGRKLGIRGSDGMNRYLALAILSGPSFLSDQTIQSFLSRPGLSPDLRVRDLLARVVKKLQARSSRP